MKKICFTFLLVGMVLCVNETQTNAQSTNSEALVYVKVESLDIKRKAAKEEIIDITNLLTISANSTKFKETMKILNKIDQAQNEKEINAILVVMDGTKINKQLLTFRKQNVDKIVNTSDILSLSGNDSRFKVVTIAMKNINESYDFDEIQTISSDLMSYLENYKEEQRLLIKYKKEQIQKIADETNFLSMNANSSEFKHIINVTKKINEASSIEDINLIIENEL